MKKFKTYIAENLDLVIMSKNIMLKGKQVANYISVSFDTSGASEYCAVPFIVNRKTDAFMMSDRLKAKNDEQRKYMLMHWGMCYCNQEKARQMFNIKITATDNFFMPDEISYMRQFYASFNRLSRVTGNTLGRVFDLSNIGTPVFIIGFWYKMTTEEWKKYVPKAISEYNTLYNKNISPDNTAIIGTVADDTVFLGPTDIGFEFDDEYNPVGIDKKYFAKVKKAREVMQYETELLKSIDKLAADAGMTTAEWHHKKSNRYNPVTGKIEWSDSIGDSLVDSAGNLISEAIINKDLTENDIYNKKIYSIQTFDCSGMYGRELSKICIDLNTNGLFGWNNDGWTVFITDINIVHDLIRLTECRTIEIYEYTGEPEKIEELQQMVSTLYNSQPLRIYNSTYSVFNKYFNQKDIYKLLVKCSASEIDKYIKNI